MQSIITSFGSVRPWRDSDAPALARYANNRKIWLNLRDGFPHPYGIENAHAYLAMVARQDPITFATIATPEESIGAIGISIGKDVHRLTAEMGYWLAEPYWGRGITTEAVAAFTESMFSRFGLIRIHAEPYAWNAASCRVLEKAGFVLEGRLRGNAIKDGRIVDSLMYARVRMPAHSGGPPSAP